MTAAVLLAIVVIAFLAGLPRAIGIWVERWLR